MIDRAYQGSGIKEPSSDNYGGAQVRRMQFDLTHNLSGQALTWCLDYPSIYSVYEDLQFVNINREQAHSKRHLSRTALQEEAHPGMTFKLWNLLESLEESRWNLPAVIRVMDLLTHTDRGKKRSRATCSASIFDVVGRLPTNIGKTLDLSKDSLVWMTCGKICSSINRYFGPQIRS